MPAIAPFQQPNKTGGITTYGGVSEQDAFNQFYPRSLQGSPPATPTTGATETAANAVNAAAQAVQQATTPSQSTSYGSFMAGTGGTPVSAPLSTGGFGGVVSNYPQYSVSGAPLVGSDAWMRANIAANPPSPAVTTTPDYGAYWANFLATNPVSFRNTIIGMGGHARPYGGAPGLDSSGYAGGISAAQAAIEEYARIYGHDPRTLTEEELTDLATSGGLSGT